LKIKITPCSHLKNVIIKILIFLNKILSKILSSSFIENYKLLYKNILLSSLFLTLILKPIICWSETEPEPEYPYPKKAKSNMEIEKPRVMGADGSYFYEIDENPSNIKTIDGVEAPVKVGPDGSYYYTNESPKQENDIEGVEKPIQKNKDGSYSYDLKKKSPKKIYGEKPDHINSDGSFIYDSKKKSVSNVLYIRGGIYGPPKIKSKSSDLTYADLYPNRASLVFQIEYDWRLGSTFFLKLGSGLTSAQGKGQFVGNTNSEFTPKESFQFYIFPTTLSLAYKFQLWDLQYLTPYVDGGVGYFSYLERRSDGKKTYFGGAPVLTASAGLLISLSIFQSGSELQNDYGATQSWIDLQYKQVIGLDSRKDFSSNMITVGFAIGF
jgi:hypothetical protein